MEARGMFRRGRLFHRGRVYSDEGFYIVYGRDWLVHHERSRKMTVTVDAGKGVAMLTDL